MHFSFARRRYIVAPVAAAVFALIMPLTLPFAAFAQDDETTYDAAASGGAVARIDAISGDVAIQRGDSNDTVAAVPNAPVLGADYVTTGNNGRAEVGFDGRSAVRLGENVQIRFSRLETNERQMQLAAGTVDLRLFGDIDGQSAIDTPSISIVPRSAGSFRVTVDNDGVTAVTVREGRADIVTPQGTQPLGPGTTLVADGPASNPSITTQRAIANDGFDSYNAERDHIYQLAIASSPYTNTEIQGIGDLNSNGRWVEDGTYGHVWIPSTVAADWAPYRDGSWAWEDRYGWTWVAHEPWGWAPYHYGRWYYSAGYHHWAWFPPAPGRFAPAWSPALVGFVGFNIGAVNVGIGFGNIGWVPLAPYESFHPWWGGRGTTIVNNTTIINNTNITYRNARYNGMTSVTRENFQNGRFGERFAVSQEQMRTYRPVAMHGALPIVPGQANLRFTQRNAPPALAERSGFEQRAFAGRPMVTQRTPFNEQQQNVSRVTHVAYHPDPQNAQQQRAFGGGDRFSAERQAAPQAQGNAAPSYGRGGPANDSWSRFNGNRGGDNRNAPNANGAPAYARPAQQQGASYGRPADDTNRRAVPAYTRPSFSNESRVQSDVRPQGATPSFARPQAPANYDRTAPANPSSNRFNNTAPQTQSQSQGQPQFQQQRGQFDRGAAPSYQRQAAPAYDRQAAPSYQRQAAPANQQQAPAYQRQAAPAYQRDAAPAYQHQAAPAYQQQRQAAPAYQRQERAAPAAAPQHAEAQPNARASRGDDGRRDH
jgi:hypothetical protein